MSEWLGAHGRLQWNRLHHFSGDCYDGDSTIKPLSCRDGIDNDDDGTVDQNDPDCFVGYKEDGSEPEVAQELFDGHDNDCDGYVAAIELDCDDDGTFPLLPAESYGYDTTTPFERAADVGLEACEGETKYLTCWGESRKLICDDISAEICLEDGSGEIEYKGTGLWMLNVSESEDGFSGRYDGGRRLWSNPVCSRGGGDCDDQCSMRCPGQSEACDGVDNDCSGTLAGTDSDGIQTHWNPKLESLECSLLLSWTLTAMAS